MFAFSDIHHPISLYMDMLRYLSFVVSEYTEFVWTR